LTFGQQTIQHIETIYQWLFKGMAVVSSTWVFLDFDQWSVAVIKAPKARPPRDRCPPSGVALHYKYSI